MTDRYQRHSLIDWFNQEKVQEAHVVVVGAGATGNEVLKNLALLGVGNIHVFDFDRIEEHNLTRCVLFRDSDIGRYKADAAAESCRNIDPNVRVQSSCSDFWEGLSLDEIDGADAVVSCVDNFEARTQLNRLCLMMGTDFYNTAIDSRYATVEIFPFSTNKECACYECTLPSSVYTNTGKRYSCGWLRKVAFEEKKIPTTAITSSMAGATAVSLMLNRISGHPQAIQGAVKYFQDVITLASTLSILQKNEGCFTCKSADRNALRTSAKRFCAKEPSIPLVGEARGEIVLSEPVLIRGVCKLCGRQQEYFESTRRVTDAVTFCSDCGAQSVSTEFVETLDPDYFRKLFSGRYLPCKFFTYNVNGQQIILELEE